MSNKRDTYLFKPTMKHSRRGSLGVITDSVAVRQIFVSAGTEDPFTTTGILHLSLSHHNPLTLSQQRFYLPDQGTDLASTVESWGRSSCFQTAQPFSSETKWWFGTPWNTLTHTLKQPPTNKIRPKIQKKTNPQNNKSLVLMFCKDHPFCVQILIGNSPGTWVVVVFPEDIIFSENAFCTLSLILTKQGNKTFYIFVFTSSLHFPEAFWFCIHSQAGQSLLLASMVH